LIGLLGATGYTGKLVAAVLDERGLTHRRGGRSADKLADLPASQHAEPFVVDVTEPSRVDAFFDGIDVVINTVGPFTQFGMPVVEAAARHGVAYVDSTGEFGFMNDVYVRFGGPGTEASAPIVPACGFDYIPGDLCAAVAGAELAEPVAEVTVAYELLGMVPSRGTVRTGVGVMAGEVSGQTRPAPRRARFSDGPRTGLQIPWGEEVTVPRHVKGADVATVVSLPGLSAMAPLIPFMMQATRLALPLAEQFVDLVPEGPSESLRRRSRFTITAEARGASGKTSAVVGRGTDPYGLTARFLVEAAVRLRDGSGAKGAMAPAEALDPVGFLDAVSGSDPDFSWQRAGG